MEGITTLFLIMKILLLLPLLLGFSVPAIAHNEFNGFKVVNRVVNPEGANGWAIVESSNHQNIWKWASVWVDNFGVDVEVTPVLTDQEFLSVHKEIAAASDE